MEGSQGSDLRVKGHHPGRRVERLLVGWGEESWGLVEKIVWDENRTKLPPNIYTAEKPVKFMLQGDVGTCLRQAASSHAFDSDQPKTAGGADSSSGWQWVDGVRWLHRKWGWKSARGKWEGGWDPGGCTWHVESTRWARHAADWRRHKFKTRPPPQLLPPTTFQNNCVTLTQNNL